MAEKIPKVEEDTERDAFSITDKTSMAEENDETRLFTGPTIGSSQDYTVREDIDAEMHAAVKLQHQKE